MKEEEIIILNKFVKHICMCNHGCKYWWPNTGRMCISWVNIQLFYLYKMLTRTGRNCWQFRAVTILTRKLSFSLPNSWHVKRHGTITWQQFLPLRQLGPQWWAAIDARAASLQHAMMSWLPCLTLLSRRSWLSRLSWLPCMSLLSSLSWLTWQSWWTAWLWPWLHGLGAISWPGERSPLHQGQGVPAPSRVSWGRCSVPAPAS